MHRKTGSPGGNKPALPVTVTSIRPQRKNPDRFSLYHKEQFITGVSSDTLVRFNLEKGVEITPVLFDRITAQEMTTGIRDYFLRLLGRRDHSREELRLKALKKGFPSTALNPVLDGLEQKGYLDEEEFARKYASDQLRIRNWGPRKIRRELIRKGIEDTKVDDILSKLADDLELMQICVDLIHKRKRHFSRERDILKRRQKIAAYLQTKGFTFATINRALPDIQDRLNVQEHHT